MLCYENELGNQSRKLILTLIVLDRSGTLILKYWYKTDVEVEYNQIITKTKNAFCIKQGKHFLQLF